MKDADSDATAPTPAPKIKLKSTRIKPALAPAPTPIATTQVAETPGATSPVSAEDANDAKPKIPAAPF
jgi:hypothetical protein